MAEKTKPTMRRPSLFVIKELLQEIRKAGMDEKFSMATFNFLAGPPISNRQDLSRYLNLLIELGWAVKKERKDFMGERTFYEITERGTRFLRLFPKKPVTKS
jgi:predicted transcriptional regulator